MKTLTAAELQALADAAAWREYLQAQRAKQVERIAVMQVMIDARAKEIVAAKAKIAELDKDLASGKIGTVPRPAPGGVTISVPAATLKVEGK
jgi:hypothetical protein